MLSKCGREKRPAPAKANNVLTSITRCLEMFTPLWTKTILSTWRNSTSLRNCKARSAAMEAIKEKRRAAKEEKDEKRQNQAGWPSTGGTTIGSFNKIMSVCAKLFADS